MAPRRFFALIRPTANPLTAPSLRPTAALFATVAALGVAVLAGCATTRDYVAPAYRDAPAPELPDGPVAFRVFLTGNTADLATSGRAGTAVLSALATDAQAAGEASAVVVLGDATLAGVPAGNAAEALVPVRVLGDALRGYEGRVVVVPGDRDWRRGEAGVKRLEDALIEALGDSVLAPGDQSGGPRDIELADGLRLFPIDTAWWLRDPDDRPDGESGGENVRSPADVATYLETLIAERDDDRIVVVGHHPIRSNGQFDGQRTVGQTLGTLGLGPLLGQTVGTSTQSLASERYREMAETLDRLFAPQDRLVYAAAHDRSLQTFNVVRSETARQTYLVAGSGGGRAEAAAAGRGAAHVLPAPGYGRLVYFADGSLWSETVQVDPETGASSVAFRTEIAGAVSDRVDPEIPETSAGDIPPGVGGRVTVAPGALFRNGPFKNDGFTRTFWGAGYRDLWATPVTFPVLDVGTEAGGLVVTERGGGNQTTGLRFAGADGREYGLRIVEKDGTRQLPPELRDGLVGNVVLDLGSAQTPYGAIVAYPISRAAGVLLARPRLVYVPDDPRLGRYQSLVADRVALLEVRADDDMRGVEGFDGVSDVVSEGSLYEKLRGDQDHRVDQRSFLRARLVDMLVADWDRHEGQWRWAAYEPGDLDDALAGDAATQGKVYRPVATDHDFAFYGIGGVAPFFLRRFADERLQGFDEDFGKLRALTANGFEQDRRFLNTLTREDFLDVARSVASDLSDRTLDAAVRELPSEVYDQVGERWTRTLKVRRDRLADLADELYDLHAPIVDVVGSDERERFTATREADGRLHLVVRSAKDGNEDRILYERTFDPDETDEVRLFGLGGRDRFEVVGDGPKTVGVRIVAGSGGDALDAPAGDVAVYDTPDGLEIVTSGSQVEDRRADDGDVNRYDSYESVLRRSQLYPAAGYNATDGLVLGGSWNTIVPGFRLHPYAARHTVSGTVSTSTGGLAARYAGRMREAIFATDLDVDALAATPRYVRNFYGLGNSTQDVANGAERVDIARIQVDAGLGGPLGRGLRLVAGPSVRLADVSPSDSLGTPLDRFAQANPDVYDMQLHAGAFARLSLSTAYGGANPVQGFTAAVTSAYRAGVTGAASGYGQVGGEAAAYFPINYAPQLTLALRGGADTRFGDFPFYDAAVVGGAGSLRGYRRERFAGRTAAYAGAELRAKLFRVDTYAAPFTLGVLGFADAGRVWSGDLAAQPTFCNPGEFCGIPFVPESNTIHVGYGAGLFASVLDRAVLTLNVGRSDEGTLVTFGSGFSF